MTADATPTIASFDDLSVRRFHDILRLRTDVFVVEQECIYPELDGHDPVSRHAWIDLGDDIATYIRLIPGDGVTIIGRVVTHPGHRGKGLAGRLLGWILDNEDGPWELEAQSYLREWYEAFGFHVTGPEIMLDGIPHIPMERGRAGSS